MASGRSIWRSRERMGRSTAPMVKAIQQQQQEIEALRQQNPDLRHALEVPWSIGCPQWVQAV